ncbi:hypothetical protein [Brucella oryzae]|uniref:hypothetical protein n=1 Tax=Brucella oryzae TaxID=335286 RepID=UPI0035BC7411
MLRHRSQVRFEPRAMLRVTAALLGIAVFTLTDMVHAEDAFRMLKGREIGAKLTGMELTDDVHWALVFGRGGSLTSYSMGRKTTGRWKVQQDQLCLDEADEAPRCYAVWHLGKTLQLRQSGIDIYDEGILQLPSKRN